MLQKIIHNTPKDGCYIYAIVLFFFHLKQYSHSGIYLLPYPLLMKDRSPFTFQFKWLVASRFFPQCLLKALCPISHVKVERRNIWVLKKANIVRTKAREMDFILVQLLFSHMTFFCLINTHGKQNMLREFLSLSLEKCLCKGKIKKESWDNHLEICFFKHGIKNKIRSIALVIRIESISARPIELFVIMEMFYICIVQYHSH